MNIKKHISKKVVGIGLAAGLVLGAGGAAFAFFGGSGTGSGSTTAGTNDVVTLSATIAGAIVPGDGGQTVAISVHNPNAGSVYISTVSGATPNVTSSDPACNLFLNANTGQFTFGPVTEDVYVPNGDTALTSGTLVWTNESYDQSACAGKPLTLHLTTP